MGGNRVPEPDGDFSWPDLLFRVSYDLFTSNVSMLFIYHDCIFMALISDTHCIVSLFTGGSKEQQLN